MQFDLLLEISKSRSYYVDLAHWKLLVEESPSIRQTIWIHARVSNSAAHRRNDQQYLTRERLCTVAQWGHVVGAWKRYE